DADGSHAAVLEVLDTIDLAVAVLVDLAPRDVPLGVEVLPRVGIRAAGPRVAFLLRHARFRVVLPAVDLAVEVAVGLDLPRLAVRVEQHHDVGLLVAVLVVEEPRELAPAVVEALVRALLEEVALGDALRLLIAPAAGGRGHRQRHSEEEESGPHAERNTTSNRDGQGPLVLIRSSDVVASIHPGPAAGAVSDARAVLAARMLRVLSAVLLTGLCLVIAGSVLAFGSVYIWAHRPLFYATGVLALIALARIATIVYLRRRLGRSRFAFHSSGRWLVLDVEEPYGIRTWSFDLDRALVPIPPLVLPGVLFVAWVVLQMIPLPAGLANTL